MFLASVLSLFVRLLLTDVVWGFAERLDRNFAWNFGRSLHAKLPAEGFMGGRVQRKTLRKSKRHDIKDVAQIESGGVWAGSQGGPGEVLEALWSAF